MTLGWYLRATRLGYRKVQGRDFFMRMRPAGTSRWAIDLHPMALIAAEKGKTKQEQHIVWWERPDGVADEGRELFALCPTLRIIKSIHRPLSFYVNDEGHVVA